MKCFICVSLGQVSVVICTLLYLINNSSLSIKSVLDLCKFASFVDTADAAPSGVKCVVVAPPSGAWRLHSGEIITYWKLEADTIHRLRVIYNGVYIAGVGHRWKTYSLETSVVNVVYMCYVLFIDAIEGVGWRCLWCNATVWTAWRFFNPLCLWGWFNYHF